jgi:hypothetical protein
LINPTSQRFLRAARYFSCFPYAENETKAKISDMSSTHLHSVGGEGTSVGTLQPAATKCQSAEGLVDVLQEFLGARKAERDVRSVEVFHVMRALQILSEVTTGKRAGLDWMVMRWGQGTSTTNPRPVDPKVSMAYTSPSSIRAVSPSTTE